MHHEEGRSPRIDTPPHLRLREERRAVDLCVVGYGPTAVTTALLALERGLSVALLSTLGHGPSSVVRPGSLTLGHPFGYRWVVRHHGRSRAKSFLRLAGGGCVQVRRLVDQLGLTSSWTRIDAWLRDGTPDRSRHLVREVETRRALGMGIDEAASGPALPLPTAPTLRTDSEIRIDEDRYVRAAAAFAEDEGCHADPTRILRLRRHPMQPFPWQLVTERSYLEARHLVLTDEVRGGAVAMAGRGFAADTALLEGAGDVVPGSCRLHGRHPIEVVIDPEPEPSRHRIWVTRYAPLGADPAGFHDWVEQRWPDALVRHRWRQESRMYAGLPTFGQVGRSGRWQLGGLQAWGLAVQAAAARQVVDSLTGARGHRRTTFHLPAPAPRATGAPEPLPPSVESPAHDVSAPTTTFSAPTPSTEDVPDTPLADEVPVGTAEGQR